MEIHDSGRALVRELRVLRLARGEQEIVLDGIPAGAELSTLVFRSRRVPIEVREWHRRSGMEGGAGQHFSLGTGDDVIWRPSESGGDVATDDVAVRLYSPVDASAVGVDVIYAVTGLFWSASYDISVRGEEKGGTEPVSVDLAGRLQIDNRTSRGFSNVQVTVVGAGDVARPERTVGPGILDLDRNDPLTDLWFAEGRETPVLFMYRLAAPVGMNANSSAEAPLIDLKRVPAKRQYSILSQAVPLDSREPMPLRKWIVFRNPADAGAESLPPGKVRIFLGGMRQQLLQEGVFRRTPPGGEIRVDLGDSDEVRGSRELRLRTRPVAGSYDEVYVISVTNASASDVLVEVEEEPPVPLAWSVISSTEPYRESARRLHFQYEVEAGALKKVEYRIRVASPGI